MLLIITTGGQDIFLSITRHSFTNPQIMQLKKTVPVHIDFMTRISIDFKYNLLKHGHPSHKIFKDLAFPIYWVPLKVT